MSKALDSQLCQGAGIGTAAEPPVDGGLLAPEEFGEVALRRACEFEIRV